MRLDIALAAQWVKPQSRILDLGCGEGELLAHLAKTRQVTGYGLEIDPEKITTAIKQGVSVVEQDLNSGLGNFRDQSFDTVIMNQALQAVQKPDEILDDMLRVGKQAIVIFPNFAHWVTRFYLTYLGKMPVSKALPYTWYNTPNIHLCTFKDFDELCAQKNIRILDRLALNGNQEAGFFAKLLPNLMGEIAVYRLTKKD
jgi:methionine biosynthesis protein MetW